MAASLTLVVGVYKRVCDVSTQPMQRGSKAISNFEPLKPVGALGK
ncbi:hypothetical protein [Polynucleobacter sp. 39-46-10]|nr:hypothetical protein [Polynucleobacter sp. 39-46-10]